MANVIAQEMASEFHEALGQSIANVSDLNALLLAASDKAIIHLDEAHEIDRKLQTALYLALDKRKVFATGGKCVHSIPIEDFTLLLSTTDEYCLLQPLRDRMRLVLRFDFYSDEDLTTMLRHRIKALAWNVHESLLPLIAQRSRGTPRSALRLLQACRRVCRSEGQETITPEHLQRACTLEGIDDLGLGPTEQQYLRLLMDGPTAIERPGIVPRSSTTHRFPGHGAVSDPCRAGDEGRPKQEGIDGQWLRAGVKITSTRCPKVVQGMSDERPGQSGRRLATPGCEPPSIPCPDDFHK